MNKLGVRIKYLRQRENIQQKEFAKKIGVSNVVLSRYETGERKPDYETLEKIADYFNVSTDYLLGRTDNEDGELPVDEMTDEEVNEEIKKITKELNVWYKENPKDKREELETIRDIIKLYTSKK